MSRWFQDEHSVPHGESYDERWRRLEESGEWIHGEADLIAWLGARRVLDAGCGTGRLAIELDRRGIEVVGVDLDQRMLDVARTKAPHLRWILGDLLDVTVESSSDGLNTDNMSVGVVGDVSPVGAGVQTFDVIAMAGNVMVFVAVNTEAAIIANMARHLAPGGRLVAGFQVGQTPLTLDMYDSFAMHAGLVLEYRWATWERAPYEGGNYAVSVHRAIEE